MLYRWQLNAYSLLYHVSDGVKYYNIVICLLSDQLASSAVRVCTVPTCTSIYTPCWDTLILNQVLPFVPCFIHPQTSMLFERLAWSYPSERVLSCEVSTLTHSTTIQELNKFPRITGILVFPRSVLYIYIPNPHCLPTYE